MNNEAAIPQIPLTRGPGGRRAAAREDLVSLDLSSLLIDERKLNYAAEMLKLMGHPVRLQIVALLAEAGELPAGAFHEVLNEPQPSVSLHLNRMRSLQLLKTRKHGGNVFYSLAQPQLLNLLRCVRSCEI